VYALLAPYFSRLHSCFAQAHAVWASDIAPRFGRATKRTRANVIHDLTLDEVARIFDAIPGALPLEAQGRRLLRLTVAGGDHIVLQFKKLSGKMLPSNIKTQGTMAFYDEQRDLPGLPASVRLTLGYTVTKLGLFGGVFCVNTDGEQVRWSFEVPTPAVAAATPLRTSKHPGKSRVRAKPDATRKRGVKAPPKTSGDTET
jgi:hypothetical protein